MKGLPISAFPLWFSEAPLHWARLAQRPRRLQQPTTTARMQHVDTETNSGKVAISPTAQRFFGSRPGMFFACLAACLLWGSAFPCVKIGYGLFAIDAADTASIVLYAGMRFTLAGILVVLGMSIVQHRAFLPKREDMKPILVLALFQTILQYLFFYVGLAHARGVTSSIIEATNSFFTVLLAAFVFRNEKMTGRKLLGCLVGFAGVALVDLSGQTGSGIAFTLAGEGLVLISTIASAASSNLAKGYSKEHDPVLLSAWQFAIGGLVMILCGLLMGGHAAPADAAHPLPALLLLLYLAFISAAAYSLWSLALACNPVSKVAVFGFMNPVFGVILSAILLGEGSSLDPVATIVALILVSLGVVIVNRPAKTA